MGLDHTTICLKNQGNDPIEIQLLSHHGAREGAPKKNIALGMRDGLATQPAPWP
jgi:hypothetical protein